MHRHCLSLAITSLLALSPAWSSAADLEGRVTRIENMLDNQRGSDLTLQLQGMERELQRLRGLVEQQKYELDSLKRTQGEPGQSGDSRWSGPAGQGTEEPVVDQVAAPAAPGLAREPAPAPVGEVARPRAGVESQVPPLTSVAPPEPAVPEATPPVAVTPPPVVEQAPLPAQGEQEAYIKAVEPLKQRRFEEASVALTDFLARYPQSANADKAHFWLAETHYVNRNIPAALAEFQGVLKDYPKSSKVPGALLKIGYIQDDAKDPKAARITLEEVVRRFPQSGEARLAQSRLDQMRKEGR